MAALLALERPRRGTVFGGLRPGDNSALK